MKHQCPVCGYFSPHPFNSYDICPCCGTMFGYQDAGEGLSGPHAKYFTHKYLRENWVKDGCPWFSTYTQPPEGWNPHKQLDDWEAAIISRQHLKGTKIWDRIWPWIQPPLVLAALWLMWWVAVQFTEYIERNSIQPL